MVREKSGDRGLKTGERSPGTEDRRSGNGDWRVKSGVLGKKGRELRAESRVGKDRVVLRIRKVRGFVVGIPGWVRSRPQAVREWHREDKKKKKYRSFRLQKKIKPEPKPIGSIRSLLKDTLQFLWVHKRVLLGIFLIQGLLYIMLVRSPLTTSMGTIQDSVNSVFGEEGANSVGGTFATLSTVISVSGAGQSNVVASTVLTVFMSFVYIWAIRQLHAGQKINVRDAYYQSPTPMVPCLLILLLISLQLVPFMLMSFVYSMARTGGLFRSGFEDLSIFTLTLLITLLCFYWVTSTVIAFYIATLPGMYPVQALKGAKRLVQFRRFAVFKRIFVLPIVLGVAYTVLLLLAIRILPNQVFVAAEIMQLLFLPFVHTYLYKLYRALI